jgi:hypothetical protein
VFLHKVHYISAIYPIIMVPRLITTSLTAHLVGHHFFNGPLCAPLLSPLNVAVPFSLAQSFEQFRILSLGCYGHNLDG